MPHCTPRPPVDGDGADWPAARRVPTRRLQAGSVRDDTDTLIDEVPVALSYDGISHAVMLATPRDLEDFALGFSLSEGILASAAELYDCEAIASADGITLDMRVASQRLAALKTRRRALTGRTGCGLCGVDSLRAAIRPIPPLPGPTGNIAADAIQRALAALDAHQALHALTGGAHAAAWADRQGELLAVREDVGRHNALDKLLGHLARAGIDRADGFALITSRASLEMVQKAATLGITVLAAISTPTAHAARIADGCGLTLIGMARAGRMSLYTHPQRITP